MGNQVSKVVAEKKQKRSDKKVKRDNSRRRSTISLGTSGTSGTSGDQSTSSLTTANTTSANYEWLEQQRAEEKPTLINPRRKSVTEFFMKRKQSLKSIINQDEFREMDRQQRQHYLLKSARKTNVWAPINPNAEIILDVGCGNGIWALEVAQQFPNAQVTGIDLNPPNEQQSNPKNLSYERADLFEGLKFSDASVDYIFMRSMGLVIKDEKWESVLKEFLRVLKPGGMVELFEADLIHHNPGPVLHAFDGFFSNECDDMGLDFTFTEKLHERIQDCGFVDVSRRTLDIPLGEWPTDAELKQFGFINKETNKTLFKTMKNFYVAQWGISTEDYDLAVQEALEEFDEYHGFTRFNVFIAQKPV